MSENTKIFGPEERPVEKNQPGKQSNLILWVVIVALAVGNIVAISRISDTQGKLDRMTNLMETRIESLQDQARDLNVRTDANEATLMSEVEKAQQSAKDQSELATKQAERKAQQAIQKLAKEYEQKDQRVMSEIGSVRSETKQAHSQISAMIGEVDGVRGDVARTQTDLDATRADLASVEGDLGIQSGLIATNAEELAALRRLGERDYHEFNIPKDGKPYKVANVAVQLRKTNPRVGRFTLDIIADDRRVEKKGRTINEPIQFYVSGARQPYEMVVNEVVKGRVVGYLAVPKVITARLQGK